MAEAPPSLPGTLSRPDAQIIIDALNKRLWEAEPGAPVEALPTQALEVGRVALFKAAAGVYWQLVYTGEATYPWAKIGGPALRVDGGSPATTSTTYIETSAPTVSVPLSGEYQVGFGSPAISITGVTTARIGFFHGSTEAGSLVAGSGAGALVVPGYYELPLTALAEGETAHLKYRIESGAASTTFFGLYMLLDPKRVG